MRLAAALPLLATALSACGSTVVGGGDDDEGAGGASSSEVTSGTLSGGGTAGTCPAPCGDCDAAHVWSAGFAGVELEGVAHDAQGNMIVAGFAGTPVDIGGDVLTPPGGNAVVVGKLDAGGAHVWSHMFGNADYAGALDVEVGPDGSVTVVGFMSGSIDFGGGPRSGEAFLLRLDAAGSHVFSTAFPSSSENMFLDDLAMAPDGSVAITVGFDGSFDFGGGALQGGADESVAIGVFDGLGALRWQRVIATQSFAEARVAWDAEGGLRLAATFSGSVDVAGGTVEATDGVFVARLDAAGNHLASRVLTTDYDLLPSGLVVDAAGDTVLTGVLGGNVDLGGGPEQGYGAFLAKYGPDGEYRWHKIFGGADEFLSSWGVGLATDASRDIVLVAQANGTDFGGGSLPSWGGFSGDIAVARFDACGQHIWSHAYGPATDFNVGRVAWMPGGDLFLAGKYDVFSSAPPDFGGGPLPAPDGQAGFVARLRP